jgi:hypothetical protein
MITEKAMLAAVHISIWTAVKHDRKVTVRSSSDSPGGALHDRRGTSTVK